VLPDLGLAASGHFLYQEDLAAGRMNCLKTGILYAGVLTTVSRTHAQEIQTERYGMGLQSLLRARSDRLFGITNGIDYEEWNPAADPLLPHPYSATDLAGKAVNKRHLLDGLGLSAAEGVPLAGVVSRLIPQKGFDLCFDVLPELLSRRPLCLAVLGTGERRYEEFFAGLARAFRGRVGFYRGYSERLAHLVEAGSDLFLMPSLYEPCGLNQMYSQRYGTLPVVRRTGGLADTVEPFDPASGRGSGFVFEHFTPEGLRWAMELALDTYRQRETWLSLVQSAMSRDFSWDTQVERYVALYRALVAGEL
jgi:starch synthase